MYTLHSYCRHEVDVESTPLHQAESPTIALNNRRLRLVAFQDFNRATRESGLVSFAPVSSLFNNSLFHIEIQNLKLECHCCHYDRGERRPF